MDHSSGVEMTNRSKGSVDERVTTVQEHEKSHHSGTDVNPLQKLDVRMSSLSPMGQTNHRTAIHQLPSYYRLWGQPASNMGISGRVLPSRTSQRWTSKRQYPPIKTHRSRNAHQNTDFFNLRLCSSMDRLNCDSRLLG
jgi:hypothetical protein